MKIWKRCLVALAASGLLILGACGGGGGSDQAMVPMVPPVEPPTEPSTEPVVESQPELQSEPEISITHELRQDGSSRQDVLRYLEAATGELDSPPHIIYPIIRHTVAPTLRMAQGTTEYQRFHVMKAVDVVNSALPNEYKITIGLDSPDRGSGVPNGEIWLDFAPVGEWPSQGFDSGGWTQWEEFSNDAENPALSGHIWINASWDDWISGKHQILVHEIIHAMGLVNHVDEIVSAINKNSLNSIQEIDRDGLTALYSLEVGDTFRDLGVWDESSTNIIGSFSSEEVDLSFGVRAANGVFRPWVSGDRSDWHLSESATWSGKLVGFTSDMESVVGNAELQIEIGTMSGDLGFNGLEYWSSVPDDEGSGMVWGDGDLAYEVTFDGIEFRRSGGDVGYVKGMLFGDDHEAMGGTLERDDLTAAFGGSR